MIVTKETLSDRLGVENFHKLKKLDKTSAGVFLGELTSVLGLTAPEVDFAMTCCKATSSRLTQESQQPVAQQSYATVFSHRRAVLWIMGASYRQIAQLDGITPASVMQSVRRHLPSVEERQPYNVRTKQLVTLDFVALARAEYLHHESELAPKSVIEAAVKLETYVREEMI